MTDVVTTLASQLRSTEDPNAKILVLQQLLTDHIRDLNENQICAYAQEIREIAGDVHDKVLVVRLLYNSMILLPSVANQIHSFVIDTLKFTLSIAEEIRDDTKAGTIYQEIGNRYKGGGDLTAAEQYFKIALYKGEITNSDRMQAHALGELGALQIMRGHFEDALGLVMRAYRIYEAGGHQDAIGGCINSLAGIHLYLKDYKQAHFYYKKAYELGQLKSELYEAIGLLNLANFYTHINKLPKAWICSIEVRRKFRKLQYWDHEALALMYMGRILKKRGEYKRALLYYKYALAVLKKAVNQQELSGIYQSIAHLLMKQQEYVRAKRFVRRAISIASERGEQWRLVEALQLQSKIFEKNGEHAAALRSHKKYMRLRLQLLGEEKQKFIAEMQAKFDVELVGHDRELLRKKNAEMASVLDEVQRLNNSLTALNNEKNEVLGIVAHDLKSPLSGVRMVAAMLAEYSDRMPAEELKQQLQQITDTSDRMLSIASELLKAQQIEGREAGSEVAEVNVSLVVREMAESYQMSAPHKFIRMQVECEPDIRLACNEGALRQVVDNLLSNALKFTRMRKSIYVRVMTRGRKVVVEVQDEGPGISQSDRRKLFGKYARLSARPTGGESSTGLGLWIAKRAATRLKGKLICNSVEGVGTTFSLELPAGR